MGEAERPVTEGEAVDRLMAAFPGSTITEHWQQIGPTQWVDRLTGLVVDEQPAGVVPLNAGSSNRMPAKV